MNTMTYIEYDCERRREACQRRVIRPAVLQCRRSGNLNVRSVIKLTSHSSEQCYWPMISAGVFKIVADDLYFHSWFNPHLATPQDPCEHPLSGCIFLPITAQSGDYLLCHLSNASNWALRPFRTDLPPLAMTAAF